MLLPPGSEEAEGGGGEGGGEERGGGEGRDSRGNGEWGKLLQHKFQLP